MNKSFSLKKTSLVTLALTGFFLFATSMSFAQDIKPVRETKRALDQAAVGSQSGTGVSRRDEAREHALTRVMDSLKERALREIDRRVQSLTKLIARINELQSLTDTQKQTFANNINAEITSLNTLKEKIQADSDLAILRSDVKSIVITYRIYALYIPQVYTLLAANRLTMAIEKMEDTYEKLNTLMQEASVSGKDVSALESYLSDMKVKLDDAKAQNEKAIQTVTALTPAGYPRNKTQLKNARELLRTVRKDLVAAGQDARMIVKTLRSLGMTRTPASSRSASTTTSPTITE